MAVDYLLKPISFERLLQAVNKYFDGQAIRERKESGLPAEEPDDFIFVRADRKMVKVDFQDIRFIESLGDYLKIHLEGERVVVTRETISNLEATLPHREFIRVHRSYVVSLHRIDSFTSETIVVGRRDIPISRSHREEVMKRLGEFQGP